MEELDNKELDQVKPKVLKIISIFSYVFIVVQLLLVLIALLSGRPTKEMLLDKKVESIKLAKSFSGTLEQSVYEAADLAYRISISLNPNYYLNLILTLLTLLIGLSGVIFMNKKNKLGFHLYIIYSLIFTGKAYLFLPTKLISLESLLLELLIAGIFVYLYSRNLKWLK